MDKRVWAVLFALPLVCLMTWTAYLTYQRDSGREVKVAVQGYDPRDLLSGHYIQYQIDWDKTDCAQFMDSVCPKDEFCVEARWGKQCRFYVPEKAAPRLDNLFRQFRWNKNSDITFEVIYAYKKGSHPIAKQLLINGQDWREYKPTPKAE